MRTNLFEITTLGFLAVAAISLTTASAQTNPTFTDANWVTVASGMDVFVYALAIDPSGNLYAGGNFTHAGGVPANYVAKWNGSAWSGLGSGLDSWVFSLVCDSSGNLYAGGIFEGAGEVPANLSPNRTAANGPPLARG